jgi:hypothetical protein
VTLLASLFLATPPVDAQTAGCPSPSPNASSSPTPAAQTEDQAAATAFVDPLAPHLWYLIENEHMQSIDGPTNQINLQTQIPFGANPPIASLLAGGHAMSLLNIKLPVVTSAPSSNSIEGASGVGDLTLTWLARIRQAARARWAAGVDFKFPTGSGATGSGKWSVGPSLGYTYAVNRWSLGLYTQSFFSYAGNGARAPVAQTQLIPTVQYALAGGWNVGNSEMKYTYDYESGKFVTIPVGFRVSKRLRSGHSRFTAYLEIERNLASSAGGTTWTSRLGLKWRP